MVPEKDAAKLKTGTDVGITAAILVSWSELLFLSDVATLMTQPYLIAIGVTGVALLIISRLQLGTRSYSSLTRPRDTNVFVQKGLYGHIRHPIYLGMFVVGAALLLSNLTLQVGLAYALLLLVTNIRADFEEEMLEKIHPEYTAYKERTKRYIPLVF